MQIKSDSCFSEESYQDICLLYTSIGIFGSIILEHRVPDHLYIGNQFCHLLFPERKLLFKIIEKAAAEQVEITLVFSYIREYMLDYITELLDEINWWCEEKGQAVEIVVNDWGMASLVTVSYTHLM